MRHVQGVDRLAYHSYIESMTKKDRLKPYREKRDFTRAAEPSGESPRSDSDKPIFVIQKHKARNLHYDVRLEVNGVLKSWAVPKGPSSDPSVKRLAVATEDHPMEYADFEGTISEREYGAGVVLVWDIGTYRNITQTKDQTPSVEAAIEQGHLNVWLEGKKLKGGYSFVRFRREAKDQWLLVKMNDAEADPANDPVVTQPDSVFSGLSLEEIEAGET
jgi:DNA ligase D-like protein (predicted 3'-phosphoesterase)